MGNITDDLVSHARRLMDLRSQIEAAEKIVSDLKAERIELEEVTLPKIMEDAEIDKMSIQGIGTLYCEIKTRVSCLKADKPKLLAYLKEIGEGSLITEDVHHKTLSSWGKEVLAKQIALPPYLKVYPQTIARIRKK